MFCRKGRIQTRPKLNTIASNQTPDGTPIRGSYTFQDVANNYHTLILTSLNAYFLTNPVGTVVYNQLSLPGTIPSLAGKYLPFQIKEINQRVYFTNGSVPLLYADGESSVKIAGDVPGTCYYLASNSMHMIGLNWIEPAPGVLNSTHYPFRIRWSDSGDPTTWTAGVANTAGATDLVDAGGALTGAVTVGRNTYVLRAEGAAVMYPTGVGAQPFQIEPFIWSRPGWGNNFPYSLVNYAQWSINVTRAGEVLLFDGTAFSRLAGGKVKTRLAADLAKASSDQVVAFGVDTLGNGYDFESYWLCIPDANIVWIHHLEEGTWVRLNTSLGWVTNLFYGAIA
jgi:hypothetical protein